MASRSRRSGWIIASAAAVTILATVAVVLWLWLPRWAPVWVVRNSPWFVPAWRAMHHIPMRNIPGDYSPSIFTERIAGRWDVTAQRTMIADLAEAEPARRLQIVALIGQWVIDSPHDAAPWATLIHVLRNDPDPRVRVEAIECVRGRIGGGAGGDFTLDSRQDVIDVLIQLTVDPDATVRAAACSQVQSVNEQPAVVTALLAALRDVEDEVKIAASGSLSGSEDRQVVVALLPLLDHDDTVARAAWRTLVQLPRTAAGDARLARVPVATALGWSSYVFDLVRQAPIWGTDGIPALVQALNEPQAGEERRALICRALVTVLAGEPAAFPWEGSDNQFFLRTAEQRAARQRMVESALRQGADVEVALLAAYADQNRDTRALALIGLRGSTAPAVTQMVITALDDRDTLPVLHAAQTLVLDQDDRAFAPLIRLIDADAWDYQASEALGILGDQRAIDPLVRLLLRKLEKREGASDTALALGEIGDHRAIAPLIAAMKSGYESTRSAVCQALATLGDRRAVPALIACLEDEEPEVRMHAALALELLPDARAVDALIRHLTDESVEVRLKVLVTLARTRDSRALPQLIVRLADPDHATRAVAVKMLGESGDPRAVDPLLALLDRPDEKTSILTWAVEALSKLPLTQEQRARLCSPTREPVATPGRGEP